MGAVPSRNDGSIERADIDGSNRRFIVPPGGTFTPKQLHLDKANGKLYWSDREGMRVMRSNLDGSQIETLVQTGQGENDRLDQTRWCVGITVDPERRTDLLDAKRRGQRRSGAHLARRDRHPEGRDAALIAATSRSSSTAFPSRSISSSIWNIACSTGPTAAIPHAATP